MFPSECDAARSINVAQASGVPSLVSRSLAMELICRAVVASQEIPGRCRGLIPPCEVLAMSTAGVQLGVPVLGGCAAGVSQVRSAYVVLRCVVYAFVLAQLVLPHEI